jgi:hypothetical protein
MNNRTRITPQLSRVIQKTLDRFYFPSIIHNTLALVTMPSTTNGNFYSTGDRFNGRVGIVRVYNRALSDSEVQRNWNGAKALYGL